jgi:outer membrane protein assembly factor BamB/subtilisin family serine protease
MRPLAALADSYRQNRVIAKPRATAGSTELVACEQREGVRLQAELSRVGRLRVLELDPSVSPLAAVERLEASGLYEYVEPDYRRSRLAAPNDPRFGEQWALRNTGQSSGRIGADVSAVAAWDTRSSAESVIIAVIDTGIRLTHEDLAANLWVNPGEVAGNGIDDDGNGYVDDIHGINSLVTAGSPGSGNPSDDQGHGTAVAGVIGAVGNNGRGISGIAWQAKIMAMKLDDRDSGSGGAYVSNMVECIDYAVARGAKVINISYGGYSYSRTEFEAIDRARAKGVIIVAAAGNDGMPNDEAASYPASYLLDNVVAVANTNRRDELSDTSTYGGLVELAAPGTDILTCNYESDTSYESVNGTSFSSPLVAGALGLLRAQFPHDSHRALINRLLRSVDPVAALSGRVATGGRLNVARALTSTASGPFNDDFASRSRLSGNSVLTRGVSGGASLEAGEPTHGAAGGVSLWWSWTAPRSGNALVDTAGSNFDTTVAVYTGSAVNALTPVASNDDAPGRATSRVSFAVTQGTTYQIAVDGKGGATGYVVLATAMQPDNDNFSAASPLSGVSAQTTGNNTNASTEEGEPLLRDGEFTLGATVWYRWVAPRAGYFTVTAYSDSFLPVLSVYRGATLADLALERAGVDRALFRAISGATYYFAVDSGSPATGTFTLSLLEAYDGLTLGSPVNSSVAIGPGDSFALITSSGYLIYYSSTSGGWSRKLRGTLDVSTPAIGSDGAVYATTTRGVFAVSSDNTLKWEKLFDDGVSSSAALAADGTVYVHSDDGWLHAYTRNGSQRWRTRVPGVSYSSPVVGSDGTVYVGSDDGQVYAVAPLDGAVKWRFNTGGEIYASIAIGADDVLYVGNLAGKFFAINASGTQRWSYTAGGAISSSAAIGGDGTLYFGSYDKKLYAVSSSGSLRWTYATGDEIRGSSPVVGLDGTIYIGSYDKKLHAVTSTGAVKQVYPTGEVIRSSPLLVDTDLLFGSADGNLYVLDVGTVLATSPWPMHRQNAARTGRRVLASAPTINTQPVSRTVGIGTSATLAVNANGNDPLTFQWYLNGAPIAGATESAYTITNATAAQSGHYTVVVTNGHGSVTSSAAQVNVVEASNLGRIVNLSARAVAGSGDKTLIVGFYVGGGSGSKELLIRGAGPSLGAPPHNVPGVLSDPKLTLYSGPTPSVSNDDWGNDPQLVTKASQVGAFGFTSGKDAAVIANATPGSYSVHITAASGNASGVALAEFYDAAQVYTAGSSRLINISTRADVGRDANILIVGFYIAGETPVKVLIRGVGPTLAQAPHNVQGVLANPRLELRNQQQALVSQNDDWGADGNAAELEAAMQKAGAFALPAGSKDAAMVVTLQPGLYSALLSGVSDATGVALAEVYQID